jgi:hypothetical protein
VKPLRWLFLSYPFTLGSTYRCWCRKVIASAVPHPFAQDGHFRRCRILEYESTIRTPSTVKRNASETCGSQPCKIYLLLPPPKSEPKYYSHQRT